MNMWGIDAGVYQRAGAWFPGILSGLKEGDLKSEYLLPTIIDQMIKDGARQESRCLRRDHWFGVTYKEDKEGVAESIRALISRSLSGKAFSINFRIGDSKSRNFGEILHMIPYNFMPEGGMGIRCRIFV